MTLETHHTGAELRAHHFAGQPALKRGTSSFSVSSCRTTSSASSMQGPVYSGGPSPTKRRRPLLQVVGQDQEQPLVPLALDDPEELLQTSEHSRGNAFFDVSRGMACLVDEQGHIFSNQYTCQGELREYRFPDGQRVKLVVKALARPGPPRQEDHDGEPDAEGDDAEEKQEEEESQDESEEKEVKRSGKEAGKGKGKGRGKGKGKGKEKAQNKKEVKGKGRSKETEKDGERADETKRASKGKGKGKGAKTQLAAAPTSMPKGKGIGRGGQPVKSDARKLLHSRLWHNCYDEKVRAGWSKDEAKVAAKEYARRQMACIT